MDTSLIMTEEGWKVSTETGQAYSPFDTAPQHLVFDRDGTPSRW
jgi:hypothetical protein